MRRIAAPDHIAAHALAKVPAGHRFSLYLPLWNASWAIDDDAKHDALASCCPLGDAAPVLQALRQRQQALALALPTAQRLVIDALATSPFATGLGDAHPVENGFAFMTPYGVPYLAASGVKGVLRRAMEDLNAEKTPGIDDALINALFGPEDPAADGSGPPLQDALRRRAALSFWDVFPVPPKGRLSVEVMTPHQGNYYQGKDPKNLSPHDAGQPKPVYFLALPTQTELRFIVTQIPALMPADLRDRDWRQALDASFQRVFDWLGFGAKTAVGYGAMTIDPKAQAAEVARQLAEQKRQTIELDLQRLQEQLKNASPAKRAIIEFLGQRADKNQPELNALIDGLDRGRFGELAASVAQEVKLKMQAAGRWKDTSTKKNPDKDREYQDTLKVKKHLAG